MSDVKFSWKDPRFTYADVLTGARLLMVPYLIYALAKPRPALAAATLLAMIGTDVVDGTIARRTGQKRAFGVVLDNTVDSVFIYSVFTAFFAIGMLAWWKWLFIFASGVLVATTQMISAVKAKDLVVIPSRIGKVVGIMQFVYLAFLLAWQFWLKFAWAQTAEDIIFALLAAATVGATIEFARILSSLLRFSSPSA